MLDFSWNTVHFIPDSMPNKHSIGVFVHAGKFLHEEMNVHLCKQIFENMSSYLYFINKLLWSNLIVEEFFNLFKGFLSVLWAVQTSIRVCNRIKCVLFL